MRRWLTALMGSLLASLSFAGDAPQVLVRGGFFASVLPPAPGVKQAQVQDFLLDRTPVTNAQFARFVQAHPEWRRDRVAAVFADERYLSHWSSPAEPGAAIRNQPAVRVSWFAASAYCEARGSRLPTWYEWEYVAAASATARDARNDPAWQQTVLAWYSRPASDALPDVGRSPANFYGIQDLHGVIWEWVDDFGGLLVAGDNRQQSEPDALRFCGPGALTMEEMENYATLMRIALLSSMKARYTGPAMGFRCASDVRRSRAEARPAGIAHADAGSGCRSGFSPTSAYCLDARLTNQSNVEHGLDVYQGHPVLVTMFYGTCPAACPLLIDTLRAIERAAPPDQRQRLRVLMISIDPQRDTPQALQQLATARRIDLSRWTLARTDASSVRRIAAMLNLQYRQLPDGSFDHSSVITLLSPQGEIVAQSTAVAKADETLIEALSGIP